MCLLGEVSKVKAWDDGLGAKALGHRKCLRSQNAMVAFSCTGPGEGHWHVEQLARKIKLDESLTKRVVAFHVWF